MSGTEEVAVSADPATLPEEEEVEKARQNLESAKEDYDRANQEVIENANEFAKSNDENDPLVTAARAAQMLNATKWYQFWQTSRIPKDNKYETYTTNEKRTYKTITKSNEDFLREIVSEEGIDGVTWKTVSNKRGVRVTYTPEKSEVFKTKMYKLETVMDLPPKLVLLTLVRGPVLGKADENLLYFREHYNFVGGKTSLVHQIRKISNQQRVALRDYFDLTHWSEDEDGSIFFTSSSVKAFPNAMPNVVRGATLFQGMVLKMTESGGTELTFVSQVAQKGWVWNMVLDWSTPGILVSQVKAMEEAAKIVQGEGNEERYIRKFVERELEIE